MTDGCINKILIIFAELKKTTTGITTHTHVKLDPTSMLITTQTNISFGIN